MTVVILGMRFNTILCAVALVGFVACGGGSVATTPEPEPSELETATPSPAILLPSTSTPTNLITSTINPITLFASTPSTIPIQLPTPIPSATFESEGSPTRIPSRTPVPNSGHFRIHRVAELSSPGAGRGIVQHTGPRRAPEPRRSYTVRPCRRFDQTSGGNEGSPSAGPTPTRLPPVPTPSFEAKLYQGFWEPGSTAGPRGGKTDFDIDGRLVGNWFLEGGENPGEAARLAFVFDYLDPTQVRIPIGGMVEGRGWGIAGNAPDPSDVTTASGIIKYEIFETGWKVAATGDAWSEASSQPGSALRGVNGNSRATVLVEMIGDRRIKIEVFLGNVQAGLKGLPTHQFSIRDS